MRAVTDRGWLDSTATGAIIAAAALLTSQWLTHLRDGRRRAEDRASANEARMSDHRRQAYAEYAELLTHLRDLVYNAPHIEAAAGELGHALEQTLHRATSRLRLLASDATFTAAVSWERALRHLATEHERERAARRASDEEQQAQTERTDQASNSFAAAEDVFIEAAQGDLGLR
jgi:hypothetical protein